MRIKELKTIQEDLRRMQETGKPMHEMQPYYLKALLDAVVIIAEDVENERAGSAGNKYGGSQTSRVSASNSRTTR